MKALCTILTLIALPVLASNGSESNTTILSRITYHSQSEKDLINSIDTESGSDLLFYFIHTTKTDLGNFEKNKIIQLRQLIDKWRNEKTANNEDLLKDIYYTIHRKFLKNYEIYSPFSAIFSNGKYDCLTGTALYAYILDKLDFTYQVLETKYHMTLLIKDEKQSYLLESTDPVNGLIVDEAEIQSRIRECQKEAPRKDTYSFQFGLNGHVTLTQLNGLLYFNQAIRKYNTGDVLSSFNDLQKALLFYKSPRLQEFMGLIMEGVRNSDTISEQDKEELLNSYFFSIGAIASR